MAKMQEDCSQLKEQKRKRKRLQENVDVNASMEQASMFPAEGKLKKKKKLAVLSETAPETSKEVEESEVVAKKPKTKLKKVKDLISNESTNEELKPFANMEELMEKVMKFKKEMDLRRWMKKQLLRKRFNIAMRNEAMDKWNEARQGKANVEVEGITQMEGTLEEVKAKINKMVNQGLISRKVAAELVNKWKRREHRRIDRQLQHAPSSLSCFHCRQQGHIVSDCPRLNASSTEGVGICFKCGSAEHAIYQCPRKKVVGFPYASCFVCGERGHLSRDCPNNTNGIYINGGNCERCGSKMHLRKDCGGRGEEEEKTAPILPPQEVVLKSKKSSGHRGGDDDDFMFAEEGEGEREDEPVKQSKKRKAPAK